MVSFHRSATGLSLGASALPEDVWLRHPSLPRGSQQSLLALCTEASAQIMPFQRLYLISYPILGRQQRRENKNNEQTEKKHVDSANYAINFNHQIENGQNWFTVACTLSSALPPLQPFPESTSNETQSDPTSNYLEYQERLRNPSKELITKQQSTTNPMKEEHERQMSTQGVSDGRK